MIFTFYLKCLYFSFIDEFQKQFDDKKAVFKYRSLKLKSEHHKFNR